MTELYRTAVRFLLWFALMAGITSPALAGTIPEHPTHVSRGEVNFNPDTQSLEFAVCLYLEDVRTVLQRLSESSVGLDDQKQADSLLEQYFRDNFWVATLERKELRIIWYGFEVDKQGVWIFFEVPVTDKPENLVIGNRMLLEVQPGNVSDFRCRWGIRRANLMFNVQTTARKLIWETARDRIGGDPAVSLSLSETLTPEPTILIPAYDAPPRPQRLPVGQETPIP